uniref:F-box domain-containing protein n=1 Tax=Soboliphyme baturini TaxID=241478 RepID=A0A183J9D0_9BILA
LPDTILEYIFVNLSPYGDLPNCSRVCKRWLQVAAKARRAITRILKRTSQFEWRAISSPDGRRSWITHRCSHSACYHPSGYMYVFGGCAAAYTTFNDLWKLDLADGTWSRLLPGGRYPTPKASATMVEHRGQLVLFGGWSKSSPNPIHQISMFYNELHVFDPVLNQWTELCDDGSSPPGLAGHSASVVGDRMIVFGGSNGSASTNEVHVFDLVNRTWYKPQVSSRRPASRYGQSQVSAMTGKWVQRKVCCFWAGLELPSSQLVQHMVNFVLTGIRVKEKY